MLLFNYGYWEFWEPYNPSFLTGPNAPAMGAQKVTFDGQNKLILINEGETDINVQVDIYSAWKEWLSVRDNAKFVEALTAIGGDPITDTQSVGITYFLENGWRIRTYPGNYVLTIDGNLFTREAGGNPMVPIVLDPGEVANVTVNFTRSNLVDIVQTTSSVLTPSESTQLAELHRLAGLEQGTDLVVTETSRTAGDIDQDITESPPGTVTVTRNP